MLKMLVVEDHVLVREGLAKTLCHLEEGVLVLEAADCAGATALLEQASPFDLMLLDLGLPGLDGLSFLGIVRRRYPALPVVILSAYDDLQTVGKAMRFGAMGFVPKTYSGEQLLEALREVLAGRVFIPAGMPSSSFAIAQSLPAGDGAESSEFGLTERQAEVLGLMARGKSNRDIAGLLGLSEGTVKIHMTAIFRVLGVSSRTQAMVVIARHGFRL